MKRLFASFIFWPGGAFAMDTNELQLLPAYGELPPTFWGQHHEGIVVVAVMFLGLMMFLTWRWLRPKAATVLSPEQIAREALGKIARQPENGNTLSAVSQILRLYLGCVLGFPGDGMTTAEFRAALAVCPGVDARFVEAVTTLLRACDRDKFSAGQVAPPLNAVNRARQLIDLVKKNGRHVPPAGKP
jgi:hypothetical protein